MRRIATPQGTKAIISKYPFMFQKKFGQNFLINPQILDQIIEAANITKDDCVIEIGPGIGSVTEALIESAGQVISIEIDKQLIPILEEQFGEKENFVLIHKDVLKVDLHEVIKEHAKGRTVKVVANLPYYITTPIIMMLLESHLPIESVTVMVQKEVADRMAAGPGNKQYGAITASMNYYCTTSLVVDVPHNCFMPEPNVESAVIKLDIYKEPPVSVTNEKQLFRIMKASFSQRRKTLLNTLASNGELGLPKEEIKEMLDNSGIGAKTRGETLSLQEFAMLSDYIDEHRKQD